MDAPIAVVLAAGKGTRMKSDLPKVLCEANGRPLVGYVIDALRGAGVEGLVAVVGYQAELVQEKLSAVGNIQFALQAEQLGTGHAVMMCREQLAKHDGPVIRSKRYWMSSRPQSQLVFWELCCMTTLQVSAELFAMAMVSSLGLLNTKTLRKSS